MPKKKAVGMGSDNPHIDLFLKGVGHRFSGLIGGISTHPSGAGRRIIMIHVGSEDGFLEGAGRIFIAKKDSADYHNAMNKLHFNEWVKDVLDLMPYHSVLVLDQAKYHKEVTSETQNPTAKWNKAKIIEWLRRRNCELPEGVESFEKLKVPELRKLAKTCHLTAKYIVEQLAEETGKDIKILWLPVAHCELNPIELVWSSVKSKNNYIASQYIVTLHETFCVY